MIWFAVGLGTVVAVNVSAEVDAASVVPSVAGAPLTPKNAKVTSSGVSTHLAAVPVPVNVPLAQTPFAGTCCSQGRPLALSGVAPGMQLKMSPSKTGKPAALLISAALAAPCANAAWAR